MVTTILLLPLSDDRLLKVFKQRTVSAAKEIEVESRERDRDRDRDRDRQTDRDRDKEKERM